MIKKITIATLLCAGTVSAFANPLISTGRSSFTLNGANEPAVFTEQLITPNGRPYILLHSAVYAGKTCNNMTLIDKVSSQPQCFTDPTCKSNPDPTKGCRYNCDYVISKVLDVTSGALVQPKGPGPGYGCVRIDYIPQAAGGSPNIPLRWNASTGHYDAPANPPTYTYTWN